MSSIYTIWLKRRPAEHRDRWRCRRFSANDRLGGGYRFADAEQSLLFLIIFFWTPPHFWALALHLRRTTRAPAFRCCLSSPAISARGARSCFTPQSSCRLASRLWLLGYAGALYGITAVAAGAIMMALGCQVLREQRPAERASRNLFAFSILYLFLLFTVLLVDRGWGGLIARLAT